jgi:malate dehydrogenase (oxaloacetate-decarboxylating)(NADP+)
LCRSDYGTANKNEARKYLRTYGLAPPGIDSYENQMKRCRLRFLASLK